MFIIIVDNNRFYALVLREMLLNAGFDTIGFAENSIKGSFQLKNGSSPDVLIIDERECFLNGINNMRNIKLSMPGTRIIVMMERELKYNFNQNMVGNSIYSISKESISSENLPHVLYNIFAENLNAKFKPLN